MGRWTRRPTPGGAIRHLVRAAAGAGEPDLQHGSVRGARGPARCGCIPLRRGRSDARGRRARGARGRLAGRPAAEAGAGARRATRGDRPARRGRRGACGARPDSRRHASRSRSHPRAGGHAAALHRGRRAPLLVPAHPPSRGGWLRHRVAQCADLRAVRVADFECTGRRALRAVRQRIACRGRVSALGAVRGRSRVLALGVLGSAARGQPFAWAGVERRQLPQAARHARRRDIRCDHRSRGARGRGVARCCARARGRVRLPAHRQWRGGARRSRHESSRLAGGARTGDGDERPPRARRGG